MCRVFYVVLFVLFSTPSILAAEFFVDPVAGDADGDGSISRPWRSLQEVVDRKLIASQGWATIPPKADTKLLPKNPDGPVKAGDTIWLKSGDYGDLRILGYYNAKPITIAAAQGHTPRFRSIVLRSGSHWILRGLHVCPGFPSDGKSKKRPRTMIDLDSHSWHGPISDVTVEACVLQSAEDTSDWSAEDWNERATSGIQADGTRMTIRRNKLKNVSFGINVAASHSLIEHNVVENFSGDGMRGLGDYSTFQYNLIKNCYDVNDNHDDGFQSWSSTKKGVGTGQVVGIRLIGNTILNYTDPNQPHRGSLQGIGCFDGMFTDWVVENNLVVVDTWHGITFLGAKRCRIVNNTVIDPNDMRPGPAWIKIGKHKNGQVSEECVVRNNLPSGRATAGGDSMTVDHNLTVKDPATIFVDPTNYDFRLLPTSQAIDAGSNDLAPSKDILGTPRPQGKAVDLGAYEL